MTEGPFEAHYRWLHTLRGDSTFFLHCCWTSDSCSVYDEWSQFCVLRVIFDLFIFEMSPSCRWGGAKIKDHRDAQNKSNNIIHAFQQWQADSVNIFGDFDFFFFFLKGGQKSPTASTTGSFVETFCSLQVLTAVVWTATTAICLPQTEEGPSGSSEEKSQETTGSNEAMREGHRA